jgi:hypothetical protein
MMAFVPCPVSREVYQEGVTARLLDFSAPHGMGECQFDNSLAIATAISGDYSRTRPQRNEAFPDSLIPLNQQEA